jgi:uncharacterized protein YbcC (UPF0753/DUF2309 family)
MTAPRDDVGASGSWLQPILEEAAHLLPAQAPLEVFVHHNPLHAFQASPFADAVARAEATLGARGYLREEEYRDAFRTGRIGDADLRAALAAALDESEPTVTTAAIPNDLELAREILVHGIDAESGPRLAWLLDEHRAATRFAGSVAAFARDRIVRETATFLRRELDARPSAELVALLTGPGDEAHLASTFEERFGRRASAASIRAILQRAPELAAVACLWEAARRVCRRTAVAARRRSVPEDVASLLPRDAVLRVTGDDPDNLVVPILTTFAAAFLDRGQSHWSMPDREEGFFVAFRRVLGAGHAIRPAWQSELGTLLRRWEATHVGSEEVVASVMEDLGIGPSQRAGFLRDTLLRLPGWAGMFRRLEQAPAGSSRSAPRIRLVDFLAVRLCLDRLALAEIGRRLAHTGALRNLRSYCAALPSISKPEPPGDHDDAWPLFLLSQHIGLAGPDLVRMTDAEVTSLLRRLRSLRGAARLPIWHDAYERHYRDRLLGAIVARRAEPVRVEAPRLQMMFCLDERMESFRRHLEELAPDTATYGVAGFFNLAIAYQGLDDPSTFPLCPVVLTPHHKVAEEPLSDHAPLAEARRRRRQSLTFMSQRFDTASRSIFWGAVVTAIAGVLAALPLLAAVFMPWVAGRLRKKVASWVVPAPRTRLSGTRADVDEAQSLSLGFLTREKAERVATLLENVGLTSGFARLVVLLGHDSTSTNNPHLAAYSCGACGGRSGGPNARLFAQMANRSEVRALLRDRGIDIPATTWFIGGEHDTCADTVRLFDLDEVPASFLAEVEYVEQLLERGLGRQAHERCRRFASAPRRPSFDEALRHVEARSYDLSQARPELGHATNAACIVGRRDLTRGLFLDRRAFLVSYDPTGDHDGSVLERTLLAVGPVCAGINLEYFFSTTDSERFGAGTKLPHNVTGLIGVMNGSLSDLRTGLPRQMIEIHEPVRLQLVIEATAATINAVLERQPSIRELVENEWVHVVALDPNDGSVLVWSPTTRFRPWSSVHTSLPRAASSTAWYAGHEGLLSPALIDTGTSFEEVGGVV